jgi:hypothetical protein
MINYSKNAVDFGTHCFIVLPKQDNPLISKGFMAFEEVMLLIMPLSLFASYSFSIPQSVNPA